MRTLSELRHRYDRYRKDNKKDAKKCLCEDLRVYFNTAEGREHIAESPHHSRSVEEIIDLVIRGIEVEEDVDKATAKPFSER